MTQDTTGDKRTDGRASHARGSGNPAPGGARHHPHDERDTALPLVSIIMPTKNRLDLIGRAIDSVIAQTYRNWELIIVNDGGDDIAPVLGNRVSRGAIRTIRLDESAGQAAARNSAMQAARGQIICYLDDDDIYLPHHLETVVAALACKGRSFVYTDAVLVPEWHDGGTLQEAAEKTNPYAHDACSRDRLLVSNYIPINSWAHRKSCLDNAGDFDESLNSYEDWEFLLRLAEHYEFTHIRQTTVEVMVRLDRVDNVSRQRVAETMDTYRKIYRRHDRNLPAEVVRERELKLQSLEIFTGECLSAGASVAGSGDNALAEGADPVAGRQELLALREEFLDRMEAAGYVLPSIHVVMVAGEDDAMKIADTLDSLAAQIYTGWGLSVISPASAPHRNFESLPMLEWIQSDDVQQTLVDTMRESTCDWVAPVMPGCTFDPAALARLVEHINRNPGWKLIYSDAGGIDTSIAQDAHQLNPDCLHVFPRSGNVPLLHKDTLLQIALDSGMPAALFYDLGRKVLDTHGKSAIGTIPAAR